MDLLEHIRDLMKAAEVDMATMRVVVFKDRLDISVTAGKAISREYSDPETALRDCFAQLDGDRVIEKGLALVGDSTTVDTRTQDQL